MDRHSRGIRIYFSTKAIAAFLLLAAPSLAFAQDGGALQAHPAERCAANYAYDAQHSECLRCNSPCKAGLPGICGRGIVECGDGQATCRPAVQPGDRREICNGEDDDCDNQVDEDFDKDRDGYTTCSGDCNDRDPAIHPDAVERCDGMDNNCNGLVDEGFNVGGACSVGAGACASQGHLGCAADALSSVCDAVPGRPSPEICDRLDNDCNGKLDDGLGELSCGVGACRKTMPSCVDGKQSMCVPGKPSQEICGNGIDDNCDGRIDEGFAELDKTCYEGVGACRQAGKFICSDDKLAIACSARPGEPRAEICGNKTDDDCDGTVDTDTEGLGGPCTNGLLGECAREGVLACNAANGMLYCSAPKIEPKPEICDGKDNDCNGNIDNGVLNACNGCGALPGEIGAPCLAPGGDECGTGKWACNKEEPGKAVCALDPKISEGRECASDGNSCTRDFCRDGKCTHPPARNGFACNSGDRCSIHDTCIDGACVGGTELSCDDKNACTTDSCDPATGCIHKPIEGGVVNACGGCEVPPADPGSACELAEKFGPCREGRYTCQPDGSLSCVQVKFARDESCNGIDDDCDNKIDEDLGSTGCGIGACRVEIANCVDGMKTACVPRDPLSETCGNMGSDDDCNGIADDVAGLDKDCPISMGTCILPGTKRCVGEAEAPVCVPVNPRDAEDEDLNGVVNYCDNGASVVEGVTAQIGERISQEGLPVGAAARIFDQSRTRAAMLPWSRVIDSVVINPETPDRAILLVSGMGGGVSGFAVMRAKDATASGALSFQTCLAPPDLVPELLLAADAEGSVIASSGRGYLRYPKIASQIPSAAAGVQCSLVADRIVVPEARAWSSRSGGKSCSPQRIAAVSLIANAPLSFAGAAICPLPAPSILSKQRWALGLDILTEGQQGTFAHEFVPFVEAAGPIDKVSMVSFDGVIFVATTAEGKNYVGTCRREAERWQCAQREAPEIASPVSSVFATGREASAAAVVITSDGGAYGLPVSGMKSGEKARPQGTINARGTHADGDVGDAVRLLPEKGGDQYVILGRDRLITAASVRSGDGPLPDIKPLAAERFEPVSTSDDIFTGGKFTFGRPSAMELIPLKGFGGRDLFSAFEIRDGGRTVGSMGFFFWNANELPEGTISDIRFDGRKGSARLAFSDPTGDALTYRASIKAAHGGLLGNWIDGLERGMLRFSVKGDASAVGMWPIEIDVETSDQGGASARARAILRRDGTVESITESSGNP